MLLNCYTQYASKFGKFSSGHRTGKGQFSFQSQRWAMPRMFKLPYNHTNFTCQQDYAQNPSSQALAVHELRTSRCTSWIQKRQRNQRSIANIHWIIEKARELQKKSTSGSLTTLKPMTRWITTNCGIFLNILECRTTFLAS